MLMHDTRGAHLLCRRNSVKGERKDVAHQNKMCKKQMYMHNLIGPRSAGVRVNVNCALVGLLASTAAALTARLL